MTAVTLYVRRITEKAPEITLHSGNPFLDVGAAEMGRISLKCAFIVCIFFGDVTFKFRGLHYK